MTAQHPPAPPVWILHDGKVGLRNQVMGVAEAVGLPFIEKRLETRYPWKALPPALWFNALHAPGRDGDRLLPPWPRLVITAGGRSAAPALAIRTRLRRENRDCLVVQIQDPKIAPHHFDLMLIPDHDRVRGPTVMVTLGAVHRVTAAKLAAAAAEWGPKLAALPHPRVAVLIGGGAGVEARIPALAQDLAALARGGAGLMITPSRRTSAEAESHVRRVLADLPAVIWDGTGDNPYFGYLGLADHILATADSVSMITEAGATGKPVHVLPVAGASRKFDRFHQAMTRAGITRPFDGTLAQWTYQPRRDTETAGATIRRMMQERNLWPEAEPR